MPTGALPDVTPPIEDYLKAIYSAARDTGAARISTSIVAERMAVSPASATNMMQKLAEMKLVEYLPYRGVALTPAGEKIALEVIRHHRLIECYLAEALGFSWDAVHDEAERLEHVISEEFEDRIDAMLGYPTIDPHGDPIPPKSGRLPGALTRPSRPLTDVAVGEAVVVERVSDRDAALLRRLAAIALVPGTAVTVVARSASGRRLTISRLGESLSLDQALAREVFVA
ncbi:MAG: metal-dependent transcriptional regulator [Gemmatimonadota bacterium]